MGNAAADFGKRTKLMLIGFVVLLFGGGTLGVLAFIKNSKLQIEEQYMESWLGGKDASELSEHTIPLVADDIEARVKLGTEKLLSERNYKAAKVEYVEVVDLLKRLVKQYSDLKVSPDKTVTAWATEVRTIVDDASVAEMERILADMASGKELHSARIHGFLHNFSRFGDYALRFEASKPALSKARAKFAGKWLRVPADYNQGFEILRSMLEQQFDTSSGYTLVFAPAYGPEEAKATWRQFDVLCQPLRAINENTPTDRYIFRGPPDHVVGYFIYFKMPSGQAVGTTWDSLRDSRNVRGYASVDEFAQSEIPKFAIK
ncbi:MAG: hypothetical protein ACI8W8_000279 [Rhodothermales bacterium]